MPNCKWVSSLAVHPAGKGVSWWEGGTLRATKSPPPNLPPGDNVICGSYDSKLVWFDMDLSRVPESLPPPVHFLFFSFLSFTLPSPLSSSLFLSAWPLLYMSISPKYILGSLRFFPALSHSVCWLFATPWTVAHQASPPMGFSRKEYCGVLPCRLSGHRPQPGSEPPSPVSPALAGGLLLAEPSFL